MVYANTSFKIVGVIEKDSKSLLSGFNFLPKVIMSEDGFKSVNIDKALLRSEYTYNYIIEDTGADLDKVIENARDMKVRVSIAGITKSGFVQGLSLVEQFLILAVLLSCILSAVNIYAGMLYFLKVMRNSFAVLLAIGFDKVKLASTLLLVLLYVLVLSTMVGSLVSVLLFDFVLGYVETNFALALPFVSLFLPIGLTFLIIFGVAFASFIPSLRNLLKLNPKTLLSGGSDMDEKDMFMDFVVITAITLLPLVLIAIFLLDNFVYGFLSILVIIFIYALIATVFYFTIRYLYSRRMKFGFLTRTLISYKNADGLFGIISITSLYIALASLSLLILLQSTLATFIRADLGETLPSTYVIDVQKSQVEDITANVKDIVLFPNVGARIMTIDGLDIQRAVAESDGSVSRELGREYNLTYRKDLLSNEKVVSGSWLSGVKNEVSVNDDFAERANIKLGSVVTFSISGFEVESTVTSIRASDTRSGLPFFYFVFNPVDLEKYPATFFGYTNLDSGTKADFTRYIAEKFPNISTIDTTEITKFAEGIIGGLLVIIFVISLPPLVLALFLIVTLVVSSFSGRRKQSAQLMALGSTKSFIEGLYYLETISTTLVGGVLGYITAVGATIFIARYYLKIKSIVLFDIELIISLGAIILFVLLVASLLWRGDKRPLRELLSYEEK